LARAWAKNALCAERLRRQSRQQIVVMLEAETPPLGPPPLGAQLGDPETIAVPFTAATFWSSSHWPGGPRVETAFWQAGSA
jgi:hypothetical protein